MITREIRSAVITGPTGAVGTALCEQLLSMGIHVFAVCRPGTKRAENLPVSQNLERIDCDIHSLLDLPEMISGTVDAFFHLAWAHTIGTGRNDMPAQISNVACTIDAVRAAAALKCKVFMGAGSQAEYGRVEGTLRPDTPCFPENGYGIAKLCAGQMSRIECRKYGIAHIWPRILSVYGPHDSSATMIVGTIEKLLNGEVPPLTEGLQKWDYLYAFDAANALCKMAFHGTDGAVYPLGSGEAIPLREYIMTLRDAIDPKLPLGFGKIPYGPLQVMHLQADISELTKDTGFVPEIPFAQGIQKTIAWVRKRNAE